MHRNILIENIAIINKVIKRELLRDSLLAMKSNIFRIFYLNKFNQSDFKMYNYEST